MALVRASRGRFVAAGSASLASFAIVKAPAKAAQFEFKIGSDLGADHPTVVRLTQMFTAVQKETGGRLHVQMFADNVLGNMSSMLTQMRAGAIQFLVLGGSNLAPVVTTADISNIGYASTDPAQIMRAMDGPLGDYVRADAASKGIYAMRAVWDGGMYQLGLASKPVRTPEDMRGLKLRVATSRIAVDLFKALGANPSPISLAEVYTALQTKLIDGESAPIVTIQTSRFFEVNKYVSLTNHAWSCEWVIANNDAWKSLPPDIQAVIERNGKVYSALAQRDTKTMSAALVDKLRRLGVSVNTVDPAPFRPLLHGYYQEFATQFGPTAWGLLEAGVGRKLV